ncbi:MAG: hypothetical protein KAW19_03020 [Candidatus Aminicenantes bacterium]|nr:hypothetical protein [Candidatus Aminicenantes bacterium]
MTRPKLEDLQRFAGLYFLCRCPTVKWKRMKERGPADRRKNVSHGKIGKRLGVAKSTIINWLLHTG